MPIGGSSRQQWRGAGRVRHDSSEVAKKYAGEGRVSAAGEQPTGREMGAPARYAVGLSGEKGETDVAWERILGIRLVAATRIFQQLRRGIHKSIRLPDCSVWKRF